MYSLMRHITYNIMIMYNIPVKNPKILLNPHGADCTTFPSTSTF